MERSLTFIRQTGQVGSSSVKAGSLAIAFTLCKIDVQPHKSTANVLP
jgi:hypothetical protein